MITLFILIQIAYSFQDCSLLKTLEECGDIKAIECEWYLWNPSRCRNICSAISTESECIKFDSCIWDDGCFTPSCFELKTQSKCNFNVACVWKNNKCWDESCLQLGSKDESTCQKKYCNWDNSRKLCYDKFCADYPNRKQCNAISFCVWANYKCIEDVRSPPIDY